MFPLTIVQRDTQRLDDEDGHTYSNFIEGKLTELIRRVNQCRKGERRYTGVHA